MHRLLRLGRFSVEYGHSGRDPSATQVQVQSIQMGELFLRHKCWKPVIPPRFSTIEIKVSYHKPTTKNKTASPLDSTSLLCIHLGATGLSVVSAELISSLQNLSSVLSFNFLVFQKKLTFPILLLGSQIFKCYLSKIEQHSHHYITAIYTHAKESEEDENLFPAELNSTLHPQLHLKWNLLHSYIHQQ